MQFSVYRYYVVFILYATDLMCYMSSVLDVILAQVAISEYHILRVLNNRNLFSHFSGGWKPEITVPRWLGAGVSSLPDS